MNQKLRNVLAWRPGKSAKSAQSGGVTSAQSALGYSPDQVWQAPGDPDIGYEAATPYLSPVPEVPAELVAEVAAAARASVDVALPQRPAI